MYRKCVTEISAQHQRQVAQSLLALMQKMPYGDFSVTQLCQAAGVSRRTFYHLFNNKTGALHAMIDQILLDAEYYRPEISDPALRFFCYWKDRKPLLDTLQNNQMAGLLLERMIALLRDEGHDIWRWLRAGEADSQQEILTFTVCGVMGMTYSWYYSGYQKTPREMAALLTQLMRTSLAKTALPG